jgi:hypothetical protein
MWAETFKAVAERVGQPQAFEGGWLWPIAGGVERAYKTQPETKRLTATEQGAISPLLFTSTSARPIFVRSGSIFSGISQERATVYSFMVMPAEAVKEEVRCVHRSKGLGRAKLKGSTLTPLLLDQTAYKHDRSVKPQLPYWGHASTAITQLKARVNEVEKELPLMALQLRREFRQIKPDDLHKATKLTQAATKHLTVKVEPVEGEVGLAFTTDRGVELMEWFDSSVSWAAYRGQVLTSLIGVQTKPSEPNKELVLKALQHPFTSERPLSRHTKGLGNHNFTGEYTVLDDKIIHAQVLAFRG